MSKEILDYLEDADQLPSAPGVAMRIVQLNQDEDVDVDKLVDVLSRDPALVAKVLRTANSGMFGLPREVSDVKQAVMVLGLRTVNLLALSFSAVAISTGTSVAAFDYRAYWTQSTAAAIGCRVLADTRQRELRDEAFLAGMLSDLGRLLLAERFANLYAPVCRALAGSADPIHVVEREILGVSHMEVGQKLLEHWGLPQSVCTAIGAHHEPDRVFDADPRAQELAKLLEFASCCGELLGGLDLATHAEQIKQLGAAHFDMDWGACELFLEQIGERVPLAADALELESADAETIARIRAEATQLMLRASLTLERQVQEVETQVTELEAQKAKLAEDAVTDALTGLRNRRYFDEMLESELQRARDFGSSIGLLIVDLDHFKSVNDDYGHQVGDELLRRTAEALRREASNAVACRYGGEEFALICPTDDEAELLARAERIREAISNVEVAAEAGPLRRSASIGACWASSGTLSESPASLLECADRELYRAKEDGRNRCYLCALK